MFMLSRRALLVVLLVGGSIAVPAGQQPAAPSSSQRIASGVSAIVVDVVVRDGKGNPVTDLRAEDFELLEDGVRQEIGDVTLVKPGQVRNPKGNVAAVDAKPQETAESANEPRQAGPGFLAIVFDRLTPEARGLAYKGALACLETLQPGDFVGVFLSDLRLTTIQPYTNDRQKLRAAIKEIASRATSVFDRKATMGIGKPEAAGDNHPSVPVVASAESAGRSVDTRDATPERSQPITGLTDRLWEVMARDQQGYATTNALLAITTALGTLPGRKSVVFFAEGLSIPDAVLPHFRNVVTTANRANVSVYTIDAAGLRVHSKDAETGREVRAMGTAGIEVNADGSNNSSLWMMERNEDVLRKDPRTSLTLLAQQTGGFLVENTNDLAKAFRQVDADRRFHYLLTYTPKNANFDGAWRTVAVNVRNRRVTVRARSGYLAVRSAPTAPLLTHEGPALAALERSPAATDLPLRAAALIFPGSAQQSVAILAATDGASLQFARDAKSQTYRTDFTILARILNPRGEIVRQASQPYRLSGPVQQIVQAQRGEILFFRQPSLAPGTYTLEVAVHDRLATRSGVQRSTFIVPETSSRSLHVSSLVIVKRAERVPPAERQADHPLYAGDLVIYPNLAEPVRKSTQKTLPVYAMIVPTPGGVPTATIEATQDGAVVTHVPAPLVAADATGRLRCLVELPLDAFATGRYVVRLNVVQGDRREVREATFHLID
jgi:VWFA-related protein